MFTLEQKRAVISSIAQSLGTLLQGKNVVVATAESCTGGWVAEAITEVPGSSAWFDRGFVTYSNHAKKDMLGVKASSLERFGAVSEKVVCEMAKGALKHSRANFALAISGIAGPDGGTPDKPVGTVWFAWASKSGVEAAQLVFEGERQQVRANAVLFALQGLVARIRKHLESSPANAKAMAAPAVALTSVVSSPHTQEMLPLSGDSDWDVA